MDNTENPVASCVAPVLHPDAGHSPLNQDGEKEMSESVQQDEVKVQDKRSWEGDSIDDGRSDKKVCRDSVSSDSVHGSDVPQIETKECDEITNNEKEMSSPSVDVASIEELGTEVERDSISQMNQARIEHPCDSIHASPETNINDDTNDERHTVPETAILAESNQLYDISDGIAQAEEEKHSVKAASIQEQETEQNVNHEQEHSKETIHAHDIVHDEDEHENLKDTVHIDGILHDEDDEEDEDEGRRPIPVREDSEDEYDT